MNSRNSVFFHGSNSYFENPAPLFCTTQEKEIAEGYGKNKSSESGRFSEKVYLYSVSPSNDCQIATQEQYFQILWGIAKENFPLTDSFEEIVKEKFDYAPWEFVEIPKTIYVSLLNKNLHFEPENVIKTILDLGYHAIEYDDYDHTSYSHLTLRFLDSSKVEILEVEEILDKEEEYDDDDKEEEYDNDDCCENTEEEDD